MLGIDKSGKTQFVESLRGHSDALVLPTMGCAHQNYSRFLIKDLSGQELFRQCREQNYPSANSFIFVISLDDFPHRIDEVRQALAEASANTGKKPFTIVINQRKSSSYNVGARENEVRSNVLNWLERLNDRRYMVLSCDVMVEADVKECFKQIAKSI